MSSSHVIKNRLDQSIRSEMGVDHPVLKEAVDRDGLLTSFSLTILFLFFWVQNLSSERDSRERTAKVVGVGELHATQSSERLGHSGSCKTLVDLNSASTTIDRADYLSCQVGVTR